jgi:hypothetical protein
MVRAPEPAETPTLFTLSGRDVGQPDGVPAAMASVRSLTAGYDPGDDVDLDGFAGSLTTYAVALALAVLLGRATNQRLPSRYDSADLVIGALATHKAARLVSKSSVMSPVRAPFTEFGEPAGAAEHHEEARGDHGMRHVVGELITCPFCLSVWIGSAYVAGLVFAPRPTRTLAAVLTVVSGSDVAQHLYQRLRGD